ncbi:MAG: Acetylornithine deacetylase [Rhodanobacteraceae bacterium]|jgi:acetylornithine deacetylase/succinyl-diaminopimelate desuccinylase-like protein|nr:MAG: Acetylornithine deacetylase [Rhodanobacteraceae bacterium]
MSTRRTLLLGSLLLTLGSSPLPAAETTAQAMPEYMDMLAHAISVPTVKGKDQVPALARYFADKLEAAGFAKSDIEIMPVGHTEALVVHYRGKGEGKPFIVHGHMDVVPADAEGWSDHQPFKLVKDGPYYYGRGIADMKDQTVALVETFMRLKREGFVPQRDIILTLTGDEETDEFTAEAVARRYHDAEFALDADGWSGEYDADLEPVLFGVVAAEKGYADFLVTATSPGGHSSEPNPDNAIYKLSAAMQKIGAYQFPVEYNGITLASFKAMSAHMQGPLADALHRFAEHPGDARAAAVISADPAYVGQIRTTCVATELAAGHARNALPEKATANVNCRIFPGSTVAAVQQQLQRAVADPSIEISVQAPAPVLGPISYPVLPQVMEAVTQAVHRRFPGIAVIPTMIAASSDSRNFRNHGVPTYGVSPAFAKPGDVHAHGYNERLLASELPASLDFWHELLPALAKAK